MRIRSTLLATVFFTAPSLANAQLPVPQLGQAPLTGLYIGGGAGANWLQNQNLSSIQAINPIAGGVPIGGSLSAKTGFVALGSVGYAFPFGLRLELEGDWRNNIINGAHNFRFDAAAGGREQKYGPMVNVLYDVSPWLPVGSFSPYVGVGVGYSWTKWNGIHVNQIPSDSPNFTVGNNNSGAFAYQFILGGAMPIPAVRGLAMTVEYRFFSTLSRSYDMAVQPVIHGASFPATVNVNSEYNHALLIGLRYNFAPPPPPPPPVAPAPQPEPARTYLVFFDWDKADLTDRARQIISEAAQNSTKIQYTRIEVNGYTDTSGTPKYNIGLSIRRAKAVEAELVKDGVPANAITIQGFGDTHLLVPTGPGVREPQNRRVEIILH